MFEASKNYAAGFSQNTKSAIGKYRSNAFNRDSQFAQNSYQLPSYGRTFGRSSHQGFGEFNSNARPTRFNVLSSMTSEAPVFDERSYSNFENLGYISGNRTIDSASINPYNLPDYELFVFQMGMGKLDVTLSGLKTNADMRLLYLGDKIGSVAHAYNGREIVRSTNSLTNNEYISLNGLGSGFYAIQIAKADDASFRLNLNTREGVKQLEGENNNTLESADSLDSDYKINIEGSRHIHGSLTSVTDDTDYWRFKVDHPSPLNAILSGLNSNADLSLIDAAGKTLFTSNKLGIFTDSISSQRLDAGTYFLKVTKSGAGATPYNLDVLADGSASNFGVTVNRIKAIDGFDAFGSADFRVGTKADGYTRSVTEWSPIYSGKDDVTLSHRNSERIDLSQRYIDFKIDVYDDDTGSDNDDADINPVAGVRDLILRYDAMLDRIFDPTNGRYYGKEGQAITVQGNGDCDRAAVTFSVQYS